MDKETSLKISPKDNGDNFPEKESKHIDIFGVLDEEKKKIIDEIEKDYKDWAEGKTEGIQGIRSYLISEIESGDLKEGEEDVVEEYVNLINKDIRKKYCECLERYALEKMPASGMDQGKEMLAAKPLGADVARKIDPINIEEDNMEIPTVPPSVDDLLDKARKKSVDSQSASVGEGKPEDLEKKETDKRKAGKKKTQPVSTNGNGSRLKKVGGEGGLADLGKIELKGSIDPETKDFIDSMFEAMGADVAAINSVKKLLEGRMVNVDENQKNAILKYVDEKIPKDTEAETPKSIVENFLKENGIKIKEGKGLPKKECIFYNQSNPKELFYIYSVEDGGKIRIWNQWEMNNKNASEDDDETIIKEGFSYITLEELKKRMETYRQGENGGEKTDEQIAQETEKEKDETKQGAEKNMIQDETGEENSAGKFFEKYGDKYGKKFFSEKDFGGWMIVSGFDDKEKKAKVIFGSIDRKGKKRERREKISVTDFEEIIKKYSLPEEEMKKKKDEREKNTRKQFKQKADNEQKKGVMTKDEFISVFGPKNIFGKNLFENGEESGNWMYVKNAESYKEKRGKVEIFFGTKDSGKGKPKEVSPEELEKMLETYKEAEKKSEDAGKGELAAEEKGEMLLKKETMGHFLDFARKFDEQCRALKWEGYENDMDIVDRAIKIEMKKFLRKSVKEVESDEEKQEKIIEFILNSFKK